jgi:hypothetical protein
MEFTYMHVLADFQGTWTETNGKCTNENDSTSIITIEGDKITEWSEYVAGSLDNISRSVCDAKYNTRVSDDEVNVSLDCDQPGRSASEVWFFKLDSSRIASNSYGLRYLCE